MVSDLKNQLSRYLDYVRHGETVLVFDRQVPVAELRPVSEKVPAGKLATLVLRPRDFDRCHSEERSDEESRFGRDAERFFASAMLRLRMTYSSASGGLSTRAKG